jgi:hypothetical protein
MLLRAGCSSLPLEKVEYLETTRLKPRLKT